MRTVSFFAILFYVSFLSAQPAVYDSIILKHLSTQKLVSLSVGIIEQGKITYSKGLGMANLETQTPANENSVYKIGSLSKQFIATAIVKLAYEKKLALSDSVHKYFTDAPQSWSAITVRHLLNHTSGLERESPAFDAMANIPDETLIKAAYPDTLVFPTGTKWQYCNLGYFMLAEIIRKITGQSFSTYMDQQVFKPAGLNNTRTTNLTDLIARRANGYYRGYGGAWLNSLNYVALRPSGAFLSTIPDLLKWELNIQQSAFLNKDTWESLWSTTVKTGPSSEAASYGYGWYVNSFKNHRLIYHGGSLPGFRAMYYRFPDEKNAILILCNTDHANLTSLANELAEGWFK